MSQSPDEVPTGLRKSELPATTGAAGDAGAEGDGRTRPATRPPRGRSAGMRKVLLVAGGVVVLAIAVVVLVLVLGGGDNTKPLANPIEVRQLVARFACTASNPGTPSDVKVTAGQEVVRLPSGGCAVVGPPLAKVDRATKVETKNNANGCTVTIESTSKYGEIVDQKSVVDNGYARALVGGGYVLDLRARLYPPAKPEKLTVVFSSDSQSTCTAVANALRLT